MSLRMSFLILTVSDMYNIYSYGHNIVYKIHNLWINSSVTRDRITILCFVCKHRVYNLASNLASELEICIKKCILFYVFGRCQNTIR